MNRLALLAIALLAALPARADVAFPTVRVDWGTTPPTSCRPVEIFVDTDADTNGAVCICRAVDTWKCELATDYEEEAHAAEHAENAADELFGENLGTACADGEILKANASGGIVCGAAGSAAFTTLSADYGDETVTSVWDLGGAKVELPNGTAPTGTDCDDAAEAGRIFVDTNAPTGEQIYGCEGVTGWVQQGGASISPAYVRLSISANQTIPNNTLTAMAWDTETEDADGLHSTVTNTDRVTFAEGGLYLVVANIAFAYNTSGVRIVAIERNGTTDIGYQQLDPATALNSPTIYTVTALFRYSATDYVRVMVFQNSGGNLDVQNTVRTSMSVVRLH